MVDTEENNSSGLSSVLRAFEIIETIDDHNGITVSELSEAADLPTSTSHIYLKSLEDTGYVSRVEGEYHLTLKFLEMGGRIRQKRDLYKVAKEEIEALSERTGQVASLGVEEASRRVLLYKAEGSDAIYDKATTGERTNLHWTALGKAILAFQSNDRINEIVDKFGLPEATENTITSSDKLQKELDWIRSNKFSLEDEERRSGVRSVGVPITSGDSSILGAISLTGPKSKFNDGFIANYLLPETRDTANVIEIKYNHY